MSRCAAQLSIFAVGVAVARGARVQRHARDAKVIAGVPVLNYNLAYGGDSAAAASGAQESWIVALKEGATDEMIEELCKGAKGGCQMQGHPSSGGLPMFSMVGTEQTLETMLKRSHGQAEFVEPDLTVKLPDDEDIEGINDDGISATPWGLTRIGVDQTSNKGQGAHIYIFDTGIRYSHRDFGGRAIPGYDVAATGSGRECNGDTSCAADVRGHGTHCAGTAAGTTFGVASAARVYAVKVLSDTGSGSYSWMYEGLDWVGSRGNRPAVASMSLGGRGTSLLFRRAVNRAVDAGVTVVVAAGNSNDDACSYQPAYISSAITVGSTTSTDERSSFSNYGSCVNIWAPGSRIDSADVDSDTESTLKSGTSMACPHVSGAAALLLSTNPGSTPSQVSADLLRTALRGEISDLKNGDTNALLWVAGR